MSEADSCSVEAGAVVFRDTGTTPLLPDTFTGFMVTANPEFEVAARAELQRYDSRLQPGQTILPGLFLVKSPRCAGEFCTALVNDPPIYVHHLFLVQGTVTLPRVADDLQRLVASVSELPRLSEILAGTHFAVQARLLGNEAGQSRGYSYSSFAIKERLAQIIVEKTDAVEKILEPTEVLSVVCAGDVAYLGLSPAEQNLSSWPGGMHRFARRPEQISRAELKLLEAFEVFGLQLNGRGEALDLGAAPGGCSRLLLKFGFRVTAVDPAELNSRLKEYGGRLTHYRVRAEQFWSEHFVKNDATR